MMNRRELLERFPALALLGLAGVTLPDEMIEDGDHTDSMGNDEFPRGPGGTVIVSTADLLTEGSFPGERVEYVLPETFEVLVIARAISRMKPQMTTVSV